jgi:hypothetical protein
MNKPQFSARNALGSLDRRALTVLSLSALVALFSLYMLVSMGGSAPDGARVVSRTYEPVDSIARFREERERVRNIEIEQLNALIQDETAGQALRDKAREKLMDLMGWMEQEVTVEGVLRARGYEDPLTTVHAGSVNILIRLEILSQDDASRILELAVRETGQSGGNIKIIPIG